VGRKNPQLAVLNLSSLPDALQPVLKAIQESGMNLNPQQEGTTIYVALPKYLSNFSEFYFINTSHILQRFTTQILFSIEYIYRSICIMYTISNIGSNECILMYSSHRFCFMPLLYST
jgi:hypothetical protein